MKKLIIILICLLISTPLYGGTIEKYVDYDVDSEVNANNLNGNFDRAYNVINGGLDNDNADTDEGYRFFEIVSTLPAAGTEGRIVYDKETGTIWVDTGLAWASTVTAGVNFDLSNLSDTTNVNSSIVSDTDITDNLGSSSKRWKGTYTKDASTTTVDVQYVGYKAGGVVTVTEDLKVIDTVTANTLTDGVMSVTAGAITGASGNVSMFTNDANYFDTDTGTLDDITDGATYVKLTSTKEAYIDQDVTSGSSPTFDGSNFSNVAFVDTDTLADVVGRGSIADGSISASNVTVDNTASAVVVDTQYLEYSSGGAVTLRDFLISADPTQHNYVATKNYVDNAVSGISFDFFFNDTTSDIGGIYTNMTDDDLGGDESNISTGPLGSGDNQPLNNYATISGQPEFESLAAGVFDCHIHAEVSSGNRSVNLYWILYKRTDPGGVETPIITSEVSSAVTNKAAFEIHGVLSDDVELASSDRLVVKFFANVGSSGSNVTILIYQEGTLDSHLTTHVLSDAFSDIFVRQDGTKDLSGDWTIATNNVTLTAGDMQAENVIADTTVTGTTLTGTTVTDGTFSVTSGAVTGASGNISQWTNDSNFLTSFTEADSFYSVVSRQSIAGGDISASTVTVDTDLIATSGTASAAIVDAQYFSYSSGTDIGFQDNLDITGHYVKGEINSFGMTLAFPDALQTEIDNWPLMPIESYEFPSGVRVLAVVLKTSASSSATVVIEDWTDPTTASADITSISTSSGTEAVVVGLSYTVSAGNIIMLDLDSSDLGWIEIVVYYQKL